MTELFIGSESLQHAKISRSQLRTKFYAIYPNIYLPRRTELSLRLRAEAAWLWSGRRATLAGLAAAALHGSDWIDEDEPIELIWRNARPPAGVITRNLRIGTDEVTRVAGLPVTTPARTAFDLARQLAVGEAVARLDALMRAKPFSVEAVQKLAARYAGARGVRQVRTVLPRVDPGSASPKESWLRMLLLDAGLPTPETQIPVVVGYRTVALLDMGWERFKVAVEYDGDQHRTNRRQYVRDIRRSKELEELGWIVIRMIAEDRPDLVVERVMAALQRRGCRDTATGHATRRRGCA